MFYDFNTLFNKTYMLGTCNIVQSAIIPQYSELINDII